MNAGKRTQARYFLRRLAHNASSSKNRIWTTRRLHSNAYDFHARLVLNVTHASFRPHVKRPAPYALIFFVLPYLSDLSAISHPMTSHKVHHADYAVVGSGIAGLRAAIELSEAGS